MRSAFFKTGRSMDVAPKEKGRKNPAFSFGINDP